MNYKNMNFLTRSRLLKEALSPEKVMLIEKYGLVADPNLKWISVKENAHSHVFFTHSFALKSDIIGLLFRTNRLCFAKLKYFRSNINKFRALAHTPDLGFGETELWNADFIEHIASGQIIDFRFLQTITKVEDFNKFVNHLEKFEQQ